MELLDQVREVIRKKHYSIRTEQAYVDWIRRYILFHKKRHPKDKGKKEISTCNSTFALNYNCVFATGLFFALFPFSFEFSRKLG